MDFCSIDVAWGRDGGDPYEDDIASVVPASRSSNYANAPSVPARKSVPIAIGQTIEAAPPAASAAPAAPAAPAASAESAVFRDEAGRRSADVTELKKRHAQRSIRSNSI